MILLKIAFRNLREHKTKTLIIGLLITIGITFLVVGNSVMLSITEGMQRTYRANFTGDLILRSNSEDPVSFLGGFGADPPPLRNYSALRDYVRAQPEVVAVTPLLSGLATINKDDKALSFAFLWGIEPSSYAEMFPGSFTLFAGEWLRDGEAGIVLSQATVDTIFEEEGVRLEPGDTILLAGQNNITGTKIREVTVRGIGSFANTAGLTDGVSFVDATTLRTLAGLVAVQVDRAPAAAPVAVDESSLFGGESDLFGDSLISDAGETAEAAVDFDNVLGDTSVRERFLSLDNNAWHFLLVRTQNDRGLAPLQRTLSEGSPSDGLLVENWRWGAGFLAELAYGIRLILNVFIILIAVVAVIIIMNTLVISVTERIAEIGTVRALGGQKGFVRRMITLEVLMICVLFGLVGIALGSLVIGIFNATGVPATNLFLEILFGGTELRPVLAVSSLFTSVAVVTLIGVVASLYPTSVALGVSPVQAMGRKA